MSLQFYDLTTFRIFINSHLVELLFFASSNCVLEKKVKQNLEKIEGAVKYEQPRDTGNIGNKTQNKDIQNINNTMRKTNTKATRPPPKKTNNLGVDTGSGEW